MNETDPPVSQCLSEDMELEKYIHLLQKDIEVQKAELQLNQEIYRAATERSIEHYKAEQENRLEMLKATIQAGTKALQAAFILNGATSLGLLTFLGTLVAANSKSTPDFADSLWYFVIGVWLAALAAGVTYFSQYLYQMSVEEESKKHRHAGTFFNWVAIVCVVFSYGLFAFGVDEASDAFNKSSEAKASLSALSESTIPARF